MHACEWLCPCRLDGLDVKKVRLHMMKILETPGVKTFKLVERSLHNLCFFSFAFPIHGLRPCM